MEIYVNISGFPNYQVSNYGNIKNVKTNKVLRPGDNGKGYLYVNLRNKEKQERFYVHRLVASEFLPNLKNYPQINHKDENKANNNLDNLEWCTSKYNNNYGTGNARRKASNILSANRTGGISVQCVETGTTYYSIREAARTVHRANNNIMSVLDNPDRTCAGFHWITIK